MSGGNRYRLGAAAARDIAAILEQTEMQFGLRQHDAYEALLGSAIRLIAADPARSGSKDRGDLKPDMRSFRVALAARRRSAAAHVLFYVPDRTVGGGILVVRVLHHAMDPRAHLPGDAG